jgi:hypothetical protein
MLRRSSSVAVRAALLAMVALSASALSPALVAQASTTTNCASGWIAGTVLPFPHDPTLHLGTSCSGFSDAGTPYVFLVASLNIITNWPPYNSPFYNVPATCTSYSYSGTSLTATGCTYPLPPYGR